jgi:hypothetical protein
MQMAAEHGPKQTKSDNSKTTVQPPSSHAVEFDTVLSQELADIRKRRARTGLAGEAAPAADAALGSDVRQSKVQNEALQDDLVGLAISGGGIRSATFALGVLQGLASFGLLKRIDYLSTVSGGGFIGSWLAAWIKRAGQVKSVEEQLQPERAGQAQGRSLQAKAQSDEPSAAPNPPPGIVDEEPEPIYHLRAYSNYLAPRPTGLSADTWVLAAIYIRNTFLNQAILLPLSVGVLLLPRFLLTLYNWDPVIRESTMEWVMMAVMFLSLAIALFTMAVEVRRLRKAREPGAPSNVSIQEGTRRFHFGIVLPLIVFALVISWFFSWDLSWSKSDDCTLPGEPLSPWKYADWEKPLRKFVPGIQTLQKWVKANVSEEHVGTVIHLTRILMFGVLFGYLAAFFYLVMPITSWIVARFEKRSFRNSKSRWQIVRQLAWGGLATFLSSIATAALVYCLFAMALQWLYAQPYDVAFVATLGTPLTLLCLSLGTVLEVGLLGTDLPEEVREWWASLCGWLMIYAVLWTMVVGLALFATRFLVLVGATGQAILGSGWVLTALAGIQTGRSARTGDPNSTQNQSSLLTIVALVAPPVFVVGLLALVSFLISYFLDPLTSASWTTYWCGMLDVSCLTVVYWTLGSFVLAFFVAWCVDVNTFSLHGMYANRLIRCYLGASRPKGHLRDLRGGASAGIDGPIRRPNPVTGFDPNDDLDLYQLRIGSVPDERTEKSYWGPYLLINTALNLAQGDELAWQDRKAESFVLSAGHCGSQSTGYRSLTYAKDRTVAAPDELGLGSSVALSGAAVSPNMGYHSSPAVTALLTVFNVRLGGWVANPKYSMTNGSGPMFGLLYLWKELFGRTNASSGYVYLSDGGHFDNMGVYELVRRRCRFIVLCDGEADPTYTFDGLSRLIRNCRTDFGISIDIVTEPLRRQGPLMHSESHFAVGLIHYEELDAATDPGVLVYIKASLTGREPCDVLNYSFDHSTFPHESTVDQFFTESQFESYRALGCHIAIEVFRDAMTEIDNLEEEGENAQRRVSRALFTHFRSRRQQSPDL